MLVTEVCVSGDLWGNLKRDPCKCTVLFRIAQYWGGAFFVFYTFRGTNKKHTSENTETTYKKVKAFVKSPCLMYSLY